jgi:hypothetical protein
MLSISALGHISLVPHNSRMIVTRQLLCWDRISNLRKRFEMNQKQLHGGNLFQHRLRHRRRI